MWYSGKVFRSIAGIRERLRRKREFGDVPTRNQASVIGDFTSFWVADMYRRGAPQAEDRMILSARGPDGALFRFAAVPEPDLIRLEATFIEPFSSRWDRFEPAHVDVEWVDWSFNSRRPYALCEGCSRRMSRAFIVVRGLHAYVYCRNCAGARYCSQDAPIIDYLCARIDAARIRLGGVPTFGKVGTPLPPRPKGMWSRTYQRLTTEIVVLEGMLSEEYDQNARALATKAMALAANAEAKIARWSAIAGPYPPVVQSRKRTRGRGKTSGN
jgi:hypothetical protein